jgi:hypothetical protein
MLKELDRIAVQINGTSDTIPAILAGDVGTKRVPKTNGQPGFWHNPVAPAYQLGPDGESVSFVAEVNINFVSPREDIIPGFDTDPVTGEVISNAPHINPRLAHLAGRLGSSNGGGATVAPKKGAATTAVARAKA